MSRTVGVEYNGRIWVVEFEVSTEPGTSVISGIAFGPGEGIDVIGIEEYYPSSQDRRRVDPESLEGQRLITDRFFHAACIIAITDFSGRDFDPEEWPHKRLN